MDKTFTVSLTKTEASLLFAALDFSYTEITREKMSVASDTLRDKIFEQVSDDVIEELSQETEKLAGRIADLFAEDDVYG